MWPKFLVSALKSDKNFGKTEEFMKMSTSLYPVR